MTNKELFEWCLEKANNKIDSDSSALAAFYCARGDLRDWELAAISSLRKTGARDETILEWIGAGTKEFGMGPEAIEGREAERFSKFLWALSKSDSGWVSKSFLKRASNGVLGTAVHMGNKSMGIKARAVCFGMLLIGVGSPAALGVAAAVTGNLITGGAALGMAGLGSMFWDKMGEGFERSGMDWRKIGERSRVCGMALSDGLKERCRDWGPLNKEERQKWHMTTYRRPSTAMDVNLEDLLQTAVALMEREDLSKISESGKVKVNKRRL